MKKLGQFYLGNFTLIAVIYIIVCIVLVILGISLFLKHYNEWWLIMTTAGVILGLISPRIFDKLIEMVNK
jgi:type IV secretory pathway VirB2 component (pilin)